MFLKQTYLKIMSVIVFSPKIITSRDYSCITKSIRITDRDSSNYSSKKKVSFSLIHLHSKWTFLSIFYFCCFLILKNRWELKHTVPFEYNPFKFCSLDPNDYKMLVTYGKPLNFSISAVYTISFKECVQKCWRDTTCVVII